MIFNGELDRVRGGYYPRLFYPKLHQVKDRFLTKFESVYFFKPFSSQPGTLFRKYAEPWQTLYFLPDGSKYKLLQEDDERPSRLCQRAPCELQHREELCGRAARRCALR